MEVSFYTQKMENEVNKNIALIIEENGWKESSLFSLGQRNIKKIQIRLFFFKKF
jgi:hypothetical protein